MNFKIRFFILILVNFAVLFLMFSLFFRANVDLSSRLIDLNLTDYNNRVFFLQFMGILLGAFGANFLIGLGKNTLSRREIEAIADVLTEVKR